MDLTSDLMLKALETLDRYLERPLQLIVGGGGAMLLAHGFSLSTTDIDAVPASGVSVNDLEPLVKKVAAELNLPVDWLNPYYACFTHVLPADYGKRLVKVRSFSRLEVLALSKEDLLLMKCFAARQKDVVHARVLVRAGADTDIVKKQIELLRKRKIPGCDRAARFLSDVESFFANKDE